MNPYEKAGRKKQKVRKSIYQCLSLSQKPASLLQRILFNPSSKFHALFFRYNVWPHNCLKYSVSVTEFHFESADKYNWNNLDRYICETEKENSQLNEVVIVTSNVNVFSHHEKSDITSICVSDTTLQSSPSNYFLSVQWKFELNHVFLLYNR